MRLAEHFAGLVDEAQIFNRALSLAEIQAAYNSGSQGTCKCDPEPGGLVSWWPGQLNADDVRGGNNGTPQNGAGFAVGEVGMMFNFTAPGQRVVVPDAPNLRMSSALSLQAWIRSVNDTVGNLINKEGEYAVARFPDGSIRWAFANAVPGWVFHNTGATVAPYSCESGFSALAWRA